MNKPLRILIGGSPCTHWSIAKQNGGRETTAEGAGWELFRNYLIAKEKFQPDYFLYENNKSASKAIKEQISKELQQELQYINSALVSAQNRERFYVHNIPDVGDPKDRKIYLIDILEEDTSEKYYELKNVAKCVAQRGRYNSDGKTFQKFELKKDNKTNTLTTVQKDNYVCRPVRISDIGSDGQAHRVYSSEGKSINICANGGGVGAKTGLYFCPSKKNIIGLYEIKDHTINHNGNIYNINLPDGIYEIRKLTPIECERLQTLPDNYTEGISNTQRYKCLGNGWTAEVIIHILSHINYPKDEPIEVLSMYDGIATGMYCLNKIGYTNITYKAYEIDKYAIQIAKKNYPNIIECGDAFQVRSEDWRY